MVKLKGKTIWEIDARSSDSWGWKQLLESRDKVKPHVFHKLGNGQSTSMWFDKWEENGPVANIDSQRDLYDARLDYKMKVADMIQDNHWQWPNDWLQRFQVLQTIAVPELIDYKKDEVVWVTNENKKVEYSTKQVWMDLRESWPTVSWNHVIWYPRRVFVLWLAVQKRLSTQDRMQVWYPNVNYKCVFCDKCADSHGHLFFKCDYALKVWTSMKSKLLFRGLHNDLVIVVADLSAYPFKSNIWSIINRLVVAAVVYFVWQERNHRLFKNIKRPADELIKMIQDNVTLKLMSLRIKNSEAVSKAAGLWGLKWVNMALQYE